MINELIKRDQNWLGQIPKDTIGDDIPSLREHNNAKIVKVYMLQEILKDLEELKENIIDYLKEKEEKEGNK